MSYILKSFKKYYLVKNLKLVQITLCGYVNKRILLKNLI